MKMTHLRSAIAGLGFLAGSLMSQAQTKAVTDPATDARLGGVTQGTGPGAPVGPTTRGPTTGPATPDGSLNAVGAGVAAPAVAPRNVVRPTSTTITLDELPDNVENVLNHTSPYGEVRNVTREQRAGGDVFVISLRDGERAGNLTIDSNGRLIRDTRRDMSLPTPRSVENEDKPEGMPYEALPVAIQNAVKAYAAQSDIRSITLGLDNDARAVFDVIFYRGARRDRMIVRKDGTLVRIEQNVSQALEIASRKPAAIDQQEREPVRVVDATTGIARGTANAGTSAAAERGASLNDSVLLEKPSSVSISETPHPVQSAARKFAGTATIESVTPRLESSGMVYEVQFTENGRPQRVRFDRGGRLLPEKVSQP